ncbi:MAG: LLM class flavin-dependent oxidoreductase [Acidimicrobiales bacterium]
MGSGWFELEHDAYGIPFNTFAERFEKLEALNIILPMLRGERPTLHAHYHVTEAINSPAPVSRIPVMIGGNGEKKTLRMVAQYADEANLTCGPEEIPHKLDALAAHCEALGRDRSEITVSKLVMMVIGRTHDEARASVDEFIANHGWPAEVGELMAPRMVLGGPDEIGEAIRDLVEVGIDGVTLNLAANCTTPS